MATTITHSWTVVAQEDLSITSFSLNIWLKKREDWQAFLIISKTLASVNNSGNIGKHNDIFNIQYPPPGTSQESPLKMSEFLSTRTGRLISKMGLHTHPPTTHPPRTFRSVLGKL